MIKTRESNLSVNGIKNLFSLSTSEKKVHEMNMVLQVINAKKCEGKNRGAATCEMFTATLSDSMWKYNGFIIIKDSTSEELEENDIIAITNVTPAVLSNQKNRVFMVKKYSLITKHGGLIGEPDMIKDEPGAFEKEDTGVKVKVEPDHLHQNNHLNINSVNQENHHHNNNNHHPYNGDDMDTSKRGIRSKFYTPLKHLTTFSKDFTILVRILKKSEQKVFNSSPGKNGGILFSFVVQDEEGAEMQVTCFNKAVKKFYEIIRENKVYEITGGYIKINDKKFNSVKSDYKIVIDENTSVREMDDDGSIQYQKYEFVKIGELANVPLYSVVDCLGYVLEVNEKVMKNTKNGEQSMKKIVIADNSGCKVDFTLWRVFANREVKVGQVLALKNVKVGEFNGRNISTFEDSGILEDPIIREATELRLYFQTNPNVIDTLKNVSIPAPRESSDGFSTQSVVFMKDLLDTLDDIVNDDKLPMSRIKATVTQMMHNEKNFYGGCEDIRCKKKLTRDTYNWYCNACNKGYEKPTYYYTLSIRVKDCSSEHWIDIFGNVAEKLLKLPAEEYKDLLNESDRTRLNEITNMLEFKTFYFYVKPKFQLYNSVPKKKLYAYKVELVESIPESKRIIKVINSLLK